VEYLLTLDERGKNITKEDNMVRDTEKEILYMHRLVKDCYEALCILTDINRVTPAQWRAMGMRANPAIAAYYFEAADQIECGFNYGEDAV
jgi:hypothetical protein